MIWHTIPKKDPETLEGITRNNALRRALASVDFTVWHHDEQSLKTKLTRFSILKAAVYEENYGAFTVEDRGRVWWVILK